MLIILLALWTGGGLIWAIYNFDSLTDIQLRIKNKKKNALFLLSVFFAGGPATLAIGIAGLCMFSLIEYVICPLIEKIAEWNKTPSSITYKLKNWFIS